MSERHSGLGLWARQSRADAPLLTLIFVVVAISAALLTAGPLALTAVATAELDSTVSAFSPTRRDLTATAPYGDPLTDRVAPDVDTLFRVIEAALDLAYFERPLADLLGDPQWVIRTEERNVAAAGSAVHVVRLAATPDWASRATLVAGVEPQPWNPSDPAASVPVPIAMSQQVADAFGVQAGDLLDASGAPFVVAGVYRVDDAEDSFWGHVPLGVAPGERRGDDGRTIVSADVFLDPESLDALRDVFASATLDFWYPLDTRGVTFDSAGEIAAQIREAAATAVPLPTGATVYVNPALADDLEAVVARVAAASAVLALIAAGPLGVMLAVLALGVQSLIDRRARALALARARGTADLVLGAALAGEGAVIAVPAAALGIVAAMIVTRGGDPVLWPAVTLAVAVPLLFASAAALIPGAARFRWVVEILVAGLGVVSAFVLLRRGAATVGGTDPLLAAAPLLVAAGVTVGVLRLYPLGMRGVQRASHARVGPVALVGSARAARAPALGFAAAFALVIGVSIATFSAALWTTMTGAFAQAATSRDATFDADHPLAAALLWLLGLGVALPLVFCAAAVAIAALAAARGRGSAVGVLRVLGFSPAQVRRLVGWEFAPVAILAGVTGALLGIAEVLLLGGALDLSTLLGRPAPLAASPWATVAVIGLFAATTALTAAVATVVARRRSAASTVRMGSE